MLTRRDLAQAQSHSWGRLSTALIAADPDGADDPHRSGRLGFVAGIAVAAVVVAGFAVFGVLRPGGAKTWKTPGTLVVEKETGSRYVYASGQLRPVVNYASALLLFPDHPTVASVSAKSLSGVPHGQPVGIAGAPDALPATGQVEGESWTVCAVVGADNTGQTRIATTLEISNGAGAADQIAGPDQALAVQAPGESPQLIWRGRRLRITESWVARVLGVDSTALPARPNWLATVPVGPDLGPLAVDGRGDAGPAIDGSPTRIGQLFSLDGARNYILLADGLSRLTPYEYALAVADPETARLYPAGEVHPATLSLAALARIPAAPALLPDTMPASPPSLLPTALPAGTWCSRRDMATGAVTLVAARPAGAAGLVTDGVGVTRDAATASSVLVVSGGGGLVTPGRPGQAPGPQLWLITDTGMRYPVASAAVAGRLGYPSSEAYPVPPELVDLLPTGPALDPARMDG